MQAGKKDAYDCVKGILRDRLPRRPRQDRHPGPGRPRRWRPDRSHPGRGAPLRFRTERSGARVAL